MMAHLSPKQLEAIAHGESEHRLFNAVGAVRSAKTAGCVLAHALFTLRPEFAGYDHGIVAVSEGSAKRNLIYPAIGYMEAFRSLGLNPVVKTSGGLHILLRLADREVRLWVFGVADATAAIRRISGATLASFLADEAAKYAEDVWDMLWTRLTPPGAKGWSTLNPEGTHHWFKRKVVDHPEDFDGRTLVYVMDDNPGLSEEYKESQRKALSGHAFRRYVLGEWADATGLVYPHWTRASKQALRRPVTRWALGVDWASSGTLARVLRASQGDSAVIWADSGHNSQKDGPLTDDEHAEVTHGWLQRAIPQRARTDDYGRPISVGGRRVMEHIPPQEIRLYGDPTTSHGFQKAMKRKGYKWTDANTSVLEGLQYCATRLQTKATLISPSASGLIEELHGYSWDDNAAAKGEDRPVKERDHYCDAFRYVEFRPAPPRELGNVAGF